MGDAFGDLNGSGPQQIYIVVNYVSMNKSTNKSTWFWQAVYVNNGGTQWDSNPTHRWKLDGFATTAWNYFAIPSSWAGSGDHILGNGYFEKTHNADGYLAAGALGLYVETTAANIGSGSAVASTGTPPRIPKIPDPVGPPTVSNVEPTSVTFSCAASADNGGSTITNYQWVIELPNGTDVKSGFTGSGSVRTATVTGLTPGTDYTVRMRPLNAEGSPAWSASPARAFTTLTGIFVSTGSKWEPEVINVSSGSAWVQQQPYYSDGSNWLEPIPVLDGLFTIWDMDHVSPTSLNVFTDPTSGEAGINVQIQYATNADFSQNVVVTNRTLRGDGVYLISGLTTGTKYWFRVKWQYDTDDVNPDFTGFWSNVWTDTPS